jgi:lipoprotein-releasing system permease protein
MKGTFGSVKIRNGNGTEHLYVGGFEVIINNWEDLETAELLVQNNVPYELKTTSIKEMHRDIFSWLDLLDMNILIIITLILIVSLINMITSLLVLILEKTNMIGILKAMGGKNSSIRYIFIFHALFLLSRGLLWGNILGIGLLLIQYYTGIITLNAEVYSLDTVPVSFNIGHILAINALTILICFVILILPSYLVTKIKPVKAIRFD